MKKAFCILTLMSGLLGCNGKTEQADHSTSIPETVDDSASKQPRQFKLTDIDAELNPGDYYLSNGVNYFFSGQGDENSMDETPYLQESSKYTLDSIVDFLNHQTSIRVAVFFFSEQTSNLDSCVPCSFEFTIKEYLVSKGISKDRIVCGHDMHTWPAVDSLDGFQLVVEGSAPL